MPDKKCSMDGCDKRAKGRGLCGTHWLRWSKYGDPTVVRRNGVDYNTAKRSTCRADGCDRPEIACGWCTKHYTRVQRHGDPNGIGQSGRPLDGEHPTWHAVHKRIARSRGPATAQTCVDCHDPAQEWSYQGGDPDELTEAPGSSTAGLRYSLNPERYVPRCIPCHRRFDSASRKAGRDLTSITVLDPTGDPS